MDDRYPTPGAYFVNQLGQSFYLGGKYGTTDPSFRLSSPGFKVQESHFIGFPDAGWWYEAHIGGKTTAALTAAVRWRGADAVPGSRNIIVVAAD